MKAKRKFVVYTAITGDYDELLIPKFINNNFDYVCFTDNENLKSDFWEIRRMKHETLEPIRKARKYKILPHRYLSEYEYSIWVDGNFEIVGDLTNYIDKYLIGNQISCVVHPDRDCIYKEAEACISMGKDSKELIFQQMDVYKKEGYPQENGLIASGILGRKHNDSTVVKVMEEWWKHLELYSRRDQLSFNYVCWENNIEYNKCNLNYWSNEYFHRVSHKKAKFAKLINIKKFGSFSKLLNLPIISIDLSNKKIMRLRIDPSKTSGELIIGKIMIKKGKETTILTQDGFSGLTLNKNMKVLKRMNSFTHYESLSRDPYFTINNFENIGNLEFENATLEIELVLSNNSILEVFLDLGDGFNENNKIQSRIRTTELEILIANNILYCD